MRRLFVAVVILAACKGSAPPAASAPAPAPVAPAPTAAELAPADPVPAAAPATSALDCAAIQGCVERCRPEDHGCERACITRLTAGARPFFDRLQACVVPACANRDGGAAPCIEPAAFACKLCALSHCPQLASACLAH
jgi:hypothetical protein